MKTYYTLLLVIMVLSASLAGQDMRPNIIIILADDLGYSDIGCMGSEIHTPNIDLLAKNGILFTEMHNTAKCYPTRASLLTGRYFQYTDRQFKNTVTLGEILQENGYTTLWSGKHHATFDPRTRGFDRFYGFLGGAVNYINPGDTAAPGGKMPAFISGSYEWILDQEGSRKPFVPNDPDYYTTDAFTDYALKWIDEYASGKNPFFLYVAYNAPHWPLHAKQEDITKYADFYKDGYEATRKRRYNKQIESGILNPAISPLSASDFEKNWNELTEEEREKEILRMQVYAAMIDRMDQNIGRLIEKLKKEKELENTVIFFLSDNGGCAENPDKRVKYPNDSPGKTGEVDSYESIRKSWANVANTPLRFYKTDSYAGGIRTPMIVYCGENIPVKKQISDARLHLIDLMPTILNLTRAQSEMYPEYISGLQGIDFSGLFRGDKVEREAPLYFQFGRGKALIEDQWKVVQKGNAEWELFDLNTDKTETRDLAAMDPERFNEKIRKWQTWFDQFNKD